MGQRRQARKCALEILYEVDIKKADKQDIESIIVDYWHNRLEQNFKIQGSTQEFVEKLVVGTFDAKEQLDSHIQKNVENWDLKRMGKIEKNILRLGVYEMLHQDDIPYAVSIDEAVEIAKQYASHESDRFINGVLDNIRKTIE